MTLNAALWVNRIPKWTENTLSCTSLEKCRNIWLCHAQNGESGNGSNSHCDREDVAGRRDGHARAEHHLLTVPVQHAVVRAPG